MSDMESQFAQKVDKTLSMIEMLNNRQREQGLRLQQLQESVDAQREGQDRRNRDQDATIQEVLRRLEALEQEGAGRGPQIWRRAGEPTSEEADREPAVIVGGWDEDTEADDTLNAVQDFIRERAIPLPTEEAFVPGKKRGFAVVPLTCVGNETRQMMLRRAIEAVEATRKLKVKSGHKTARARICSCGRRFPNPRKCEEEPN